MATTTTTTTKDSPATDAAATAAATTVAAAAVIVIAGEKEDMKAFDMCVLEDNLPKKRKGLSKFYLGKSKSFYSCLLDDAKTVHDLKKEDNLPEMKRTKYLHLREKIDANAANPFFFSTVKCNS